MTNLDRITHPLRLAKGSHQPGSGKGCAMNVISYINGDVEITDYPECSARPLARLVQSLNDQLAGRYGYLSPENSLIVLDLGWRTVGTADVPDSVVHAWTAEMLDNPQWGVIRFAEGDGIPAVVAVADLHRRAARGEMPSTAEWSTARSAAVGAESATVAAYGAAAAADAAAWSTAWSTARSTARSAAYGAAAAAEAAAGAAADVAWSAAQGGYWAADPIDLTRHAITCWRELAGLDDTPVDAEAINHAVKQFS